MTTPIQGISRILPPSELPGAQGMGAGAGVGLPQAAASSSQNSGVGFQETVAEFVGGVNAMQKNSEGQFQSFVRGEAELHDVAIAAHEAAISMRLTREIRDRLLSAYQEIMRTQI